MHVVYDEILARITVELSLLDARQGAQSNFGHFVGRVQVIGDSRPAVTSQSSTFGTTAT